MLLTALIAVISCILGAVVGCLLTLWLEDRKERRQAETRFKNRLLCVSHELPLNFRDVGNHKNPFQTPALEKLVYDEALIHEHPELFRKAHKCLHTARILSSSEHSKLRPANGQSLMKELAEYLKDQFSVQAYNE